MAGPAAARIPELKPTLKDPRFAFIAFGTLLLAALPIVAFYTGQTYLISLVAKMMIFGIAAASLDLILGYGGMVSFGHAAYLGLGAYAVALLSKNVVDKGVLKLPLWLIDNGYFQLLLSMALSALFAFVFGAISLRTSGVYFIMITLAFTQMLYYLGISLEPLGGDDGMNVNRSDFGAFKLSDNLLAPTGGDKDGILIYYAVFVCMVASVVLMRRLVNSRFGMVLRGSQSNAVRMQAVGYPIYRYKLAGFTVAGAICGVAGFLFANHQQFLTPVYMSWLHSGEIMVMVILGGVGTIYGAVIGAIGFKALEDGLQEIVGKDYWMMVLGPLLILLVFFARKGFLSLMPDKWSGMPRFLGGLALFAVASAAYLTLLARLHPLYVTFAVLGLLLVYRFAQDSGHVARLFGKRGKEPPLAEPHLKIENLVKRFGGLIATNDLSLEVAKGELHAIIGPNGAGKTTLISQLSGLLQPDSGRILFNGADISGAPAYKRSALGLARSFQVTSIFMDFSAEDNVALAVQAHAGHSFRFWKPARSERALRDPARDALRRVGLLDRAGVIAADLSHGEHRQLEIAMALATKPTLLLLDEPMAGMGPDELARMIEVLRGLKGTHTLLLIEHDMDAVFQLADRITVLVYGAVIASGAPGAIRANAEVRRAYLGRRGLTMLTVGDIRTFYGQSQVLFGMSLEVRDREVVTLMGRNGMGKTTTIRSIMGLTPAREGKITWDGGEIQRLASHKVARLGLGIVPEGRQIFPNLTVEENLIATAHNKIGTSDPWTLRKIYDLFPGIAARRSNMGNQLSGGEQQMLAVGRALMTNPRLLILDEATEGLAPLIRQEIWNTLEKLKAAGQSILVVDKNVEALARIADRHYIIEKGKVVWTGSSDELRKNEELQHRYLGV